MVYEVKTVLIKNYLKIEKITVFKTTLLEVITLTITYFSKLSSTVRFRIQTVHTFFFLPVIT